MAAELKKNKDMARTPFKLRSSPAKQNIFKGKEGYDPAAKRAKFRSDVGEFLGGLQKAGKNIKSKVDKAATYISSDAVKARRSARIAKTNVAKKSNYVAPNPKDEIKVKTTNNLTLGGNTNKDIKAPSVSKYADYTKTKVKSNKPGLLEQQITKTAQKKKSTSKPTVKQEGLLSRQIRKTAKAKTERLIGPKQVKKFKKINNNKLTTTDLTGTTISGKKVNKNKMAVNNKPIVKAKKTKAKRKAGESQYQANVRVSRENSAKMRKSAKSLATNIKNKSNSGEKVDLTKKKGLGPRA